MRCVPLLLIVMLCAGFSSAEMAESPGVTRTVKGQTIESQQDPKAVLEFAKDYKYIDSQRFTLYGVADAEQHFFAKTAPDGTVQSFYWIQFEHYLPDNSHSYDYKPTRTTDLGALHFIYDTEGYTDYGGAMRNPESDGSRLKALLAKHGLSFPKRSVRIRLIHLPNPDKRSELMIIYGEALPSDVKANVSDDGAPMDEESPDVSRMIREHAAAGLKIKGGN